MPTDAIQKCRLTKCSEYKRWRRQIHGTTQYSAPKLTKPTQPKAPECTWPTVQSV